MTQHEAPRSFGLSETAWGATAFTAGVVAFTAVGACFSDAPDDRVAGVRFGMLLGLGLIGAALCRFRRASMVWILLGMALGQIGLAFLLVAQEIGAPRVIVAITAIFAAVWIVSALLMLAAHRRDGHRAADERT